MGWYTALAASGALPLDHAIRLIDTMGAYQARNVIGGQVLYPITDGDWRIDEQLEASVALALAPTPSIVPSHRAGSSRHSGGQRRPRVYFQPS